MSPDPASGSTPLDHRLPPKADTLADSSGGPPREATVVDTGPTAPAVLGLVDVPGYQVTGELGRGGMGRVLAARDPVLGREVAIKVLLPGAAADRFIRLDAHGALFPVASQLAAAGRNRLRWVTAGLVEVYKAMNQPEKAKEWRAKLAALPPEGARPPPADRIPRAGMRRYPEPVPPARKCPMPVHDRSRVRANRFHHFHQTGTPPRR